MSLHLSHVEHYASSSRVLGETSNFYVLDLSAEVTPSSAIKEK